MPKGKRKTGGGKGAGRGADTSEEESIADNASTITAFSDNRSQTEEGTQEEEASQEELFEEKMKEAIDGLSLKSAQLRINALQAVSVALTKKILPEFISDRRLTLTDALEKCLKKGGGNEQTAAANLVMLVCFQLTELAEEMKVNLGPILQILSRDNSVQYAARAKCCSALALISFLADSDSNELLQTMQSLETIFSGSYLKGNGISPVLTAEEANLHATALSSWSLLLTLVSPYIVHHSMSSSSENSNRLIPQVKKLEELLESSSLEVRMAAGEGICLAYELGRDHDADFEEDNMDELCDVLKELAKDSHKYRAKKDRKQQRSSFRDILHYIQDEVGPDMQIRFGQEMLMLDSWCRKKQYDTICSVLGSGMNFHLAENRLLRDIFGLGEKISLLTAAELKQTKHDRHLANAAAFKARSINRGKNRDKRSSAFNL